MTDLTVPFYAERDAYDRRRSGSGSITRPSHLGAAFPPRRPAYSPAQHPTVADLCCRIYGAPAKPWAKAVVPAPAPVTAKQKQAADNGATQPAAGRRTGFSRREIMDEFHGRRQKGSAVR